MAKALAQDRIHTLMVPLHRLALLVPSALVAEVVNPAPLSPLPLAPNWLKGVLSWRSRPVPVISFEELTDSETGMPTARAKIVIFYPLPGRRPYEFFGVQSLAEPQPRTFHDATQLQTLVEHQSPLAAAAMQIDSIVALIPDLQALSAALYPR